MFTFRILVLFLCLVTTLAGCKGNPGQAGGPPSPLETKIMAQGVMSLAIAAEKFDANQLTKLHEILTSAKSVMNLALTNDPSSIDMANLEFVDGLDPVYADVVGSFMQILILRIKPYLDTENQDVVLARSYVDAILSGAIRSVEVARSRQAYSFEDPSKGLRS